MTPRIVLVGGGVRSGKSRFALQRASELGTRRLFVATAQAHDDEMAARIERHRAERGAEFVTREEPLALPDALSRARDVDVVLVDCLTLWLSNLLLSGIDETAVLERVDALADVLRERRRHVVLVTNEVGMGVVPESRLGRVFRDVAGGAHQRLSNVADEVYLAALGVVLRLRPGPVETITGGRDGTAR